MTRKRRFTKIVINTNLMMDAGVAALIVRLAPSLVNQYLFSGAPLTGYASTLAGVGAAYLYGMLMKSPNVANIGIALGAVEIVQPIIAGLLPSGGVSDYAMLADYTNDANPLSLVQYSESY
jgi:hypothetical protein